MVIVPIAPMSQMEFAGVGAANPSSSQGISVPFANVLKDAMTGLDETKAVTSEDAYRLAIGDVNDIAQVQINGMKAEAMLNTTVQLTTRLVNAYKEILQMQV